MPAVKGSRGTQVTVHPNPALEPVLQQLAAADNTPLLTVSNSDKTAVDALYAQINTPDDLALNILTGSPPTAGADVELYIPQDLNLILSVRPVVSRQLAILGQIPSGRAVTEANRELLAHAHGTAGQRSRIRLPARQDDITLADNVGYYIGTLENAFQAVFDSNLQSVATNPTVNQRMYNIFTWDLVYATNEVSMFDTNNYVASKASVVLQAITVRYSIMMQVEDLEHSLFAELLSGSDLAQFATLPAVYNAACQANAVAPVNDYTNLVGRITNHALSKNYYIRCLAAIMRYYCNAVTAYLNLLKFVRYSAGVIATADMDNPLDQEITLGHRMNDILITFGYVSDPDNCLLRDDSINDTLGVVAGDIAGLKQSMDAVVGYQQIIDAQDAVTQPGLAYEAATNALQFIISTLDQQKAGPTIETVIEGVLDNVSGLSAMIDTNVIA